ncbi:hypothetical protein PT285_09980 [Lactobacillus sp. ESL0791]|uniref:hypothetical protein n=1 Tax=Lactobacillus sp. ESL0791 TaxID=2983234 RepID=UPI0023F81CBA|nr:hypothetical protein [Lactobacillus sp. ESL0791]MDF7639729.1 hypothetical protein [Lactobacillus sp. ESL0791]
MKNNKIRKFNSKLLVSAAIAAMLGGVVATSAPVELSIVQTAHADGYAPDSIIIRKHTHAYDFKGRKLRKPYFAKTDRGRELLGVKVIKGKKYAKLDNSYYDKHGKYHKRYMYIKAKQIAFPKKDDYMPPEEGYKASMRYRKMLKQ